MSERDHAYVVEGGIVHDGEIESIANMDVGVVAEDSRHDLGDRERRERRRAC